MNNLQLLINEKTLNDKAIGLLVSFAAIYPQSIDKAIFEEMYFTHTSELDELLTLNLLTLKNEQLALSGEIHPQVTECLDMAYESVDIVFNGRVANALYVDPDEDNSNLESLIPAAQELLKRYNYPDMNVLTLANNLANFCFAQSQYESALNARLQCRLLEEQIEGIQPMQKVSGLYNLYQISLAMDKKAQAISALEEAKQLLDNESLQNGLEYQTLDECLRALV